MSGPSAQAIAVDSSGNAYVGLSGSIVKLDPSGSHILAAYSLPNITVNALSLDSAGGLVAGGVSQSAVFLVRFNSAGERDLSAGLPGFQSVTALATDSAGNIYIAGPAPAAARGLDVAVDKFSPTGALIYSFTFGGAHDDTPRAMAVDGSGNAWVAGDTLSTDFPVTASAAQTKFGGGATAPGYGAYGDAFLARLDSGGKLAYATYWGGSSSDVAYALSVDAIGNAYIAGGTSSSDFPITPGAYQTKFAGPAADPTAPDPAGDAFIAKFSPSGANLWSTFWGGASADIAYALALDPSGSIYFAGTTESLTQFPSAVPTCRQTGGPFVAALDAGGAKLIRSSGTSGLGYDNAYALALDSSGAIYVAGETTSRVFFATPGAAQTVYAGPGSNAFAARLGFSQSGTYAACVLNGASYAAGNTSFFSDGAVAPGEIVSIFGASLGPTVPQGLQVTSAGLISTSLAGVSVTFDGIPAPLLFVSAGQINAVVPYELTAATAAMTVSYNGQSYGPITLPVAAAVPAIFTANQSGHGQAAVLNQDGTYNSISNPAPRGSVITLYAAGAGAMSPSVSDGSLTGLSNYPIPALPVKVTIRGVDTAVQYDGAAPTYVSGLLQVNAVVPTSIDFGNLVPLMLTVGDFTSQLDVTIAVR